ncbi:hypothetical protein HK105_201469 [Polyrhizophydium stewartii]|uniref:Uncharacterized protein n=1 Tax=Polyrhizophydium stewartii TaxID=2732419 RepID=A0ABR4NI37_9FUNG
MDYEVDVNDGHGPGVRGPTRGHGGRADEFFGSGRMRSHPDEIIVDTHFFNDFDDDFDDNDYGA